MTHSTHARDRLDPGAHRTIADTPPARDTVGCLLTDWDVLARAMRGMLHLSPLPPTEDRRILEKVVLTHYGSSPDFRSVLFVGCRSCTRHYERAYFPHHDFWTIDSDPTARRYGAPQHVVAPLERLDEFFPEDRFDLIICNAVYGYGLDTLEQCESAFAHCHSRLREQGHFVLGWDDVPGRTPVSLDNVASLKRFRRAVFAPLGTSRYLTDTPYNHVYAFYSTQGEDRGARQIPAYQA